LGRCGWCVEVSSITSLLNMMNILEGLFNKTALQEYILYAAQHPAGGLRDKPPKLAYLVCSWAFKPKRRSITETQTRIIRYTA